MKKRIKSKKIEKTYAFYSLETDCIFELKSESAHYLAYMMLTHAFSFNINMIYLGEL